MEPKLKIVRYGELITKQIRDQNMSTIAPFKEYNKTSYSGR